MRREETVQHVLSRSGGVWFGISPHVASLCGPRLRDSPAPAQGKRVSPCRQAKQKASSCLTLCVPPSGWISQHQKCDQLVRQERNTISHVRKL